MGSLGRGTLAVGAGMAVLLGSCAAHADEPGLFGRLFKRQRPQPQAAARPDSDSMFTDGMRPDRLPPGPRTLPGRPTPESGQGVMPRGAVLPEASGMVPESIPQRRPTTGRAAPAATEADPILTQIATGRTDGGQPFGLFLQVHADGTILDGQGSHRVPHQKLAPLLQVLHSLDVNRIGGNYGGASGDLFDQVYFTIYERQGERLRAITFSTAGDPNSCGPAIQRLRMVLDDLQSHLRGDPAPLSPPTLESSPGAPPPNLALPALEEVSTIPLSVPRR